MMVPFIITDPEYASYPKLAALLEPLQAHLLWILPLFPIAGVILTAWPFSRPPALSGKSALALLALTFIPFGAGLLSMSNTRVSEAFSLMMIIPVPVFGAAIGVIVTAVSLWRRRKWFSGMWLFVWISITSLIFLAADNSAGKNLGAGILTIVTLMMLVSSSFMAAAIAFLSTELKETVASRWKKAGLKPRAVLVAAGLVLLMAVGIRVFSGPVAEKTIASRAIPGKVTIPGKVAFIDENNDVVIKSLDDGPAPIKYKLEKGETVDKLAFSPDGDRLLVSKSKQTGLQFKETTTVYNIDDRKARAVPKLMDQWLGRNQLTEDYLWGNKYYDLEKNSYFEIAPFLDGMAAFLEGQPKRYQRILLNYNYEDKAEIYTGVAGNWTPVRIEKQLDAIDDIVWVGFDRIGITEETRQGKLLLFDKETGGLLRLLTVPIKHGKASAEPDVDVYPSPDGSQILFEADYLTDNEKREIWLINSNTGKSKKLLDGSFTQPKWLSNNRHFLINKIDNKLIADEVWLADIQAIKVLKEKRLVYPHNIDGFDWTPY